MVKKNEKRKRRAEKNGQRKMAKKAGHWQWAEKNSEIVRDLYQCITRMERKERAGLHGSAAAVPPVLEKHIFH